MTARGRGRTRQAPRAASSSIRIGFAFNQKPAASGGASSRTTARPRRRRPRALPGELHAEWDDEATIAAVDTALGAFGEVIRLEATRDFPGRLRASRPDIVFNLAEGSAGRNREAHVPAFCEFWGIPYTGSDPLTLSLCLDKGRAKESLVYHGIPTAAFTVVPDSARLGDLPELPVVVKPVHEGSSKGITQASLCRTRAEVRRAVARVVAGYGQPALVERWLPGRELTCAVLGNGDDARVLPVVELDFDALPPGALPLYSYEAKWLWDTPERPLPIFHCPARLGAALTRRVVRTALAAYRALGCRDWARVDLRCDADGVPSVLEVNPLPGVLPESVMNSCFPKAARAAGMDYAAMIHAVLRAGAARYGLAL